MTEERIDVIPESNSIPMMQEGDSSMLIPESDSVSLVSENDSLPVIPENIEPKSGHIRRYSTGNVAIPYANVKILSRYLEVSTSSCHDYCKYGKQALETKTRSPILTRVIETHAKGQDVEKVVTLAERKKKKLAVMPSPGFRSQKPNIPKREVSSSKRETILSKRRSLLLGGTDVSTNTASGLKLKSIQSKPSSLPKKRRLSGKDGEIQQNKEMRTSPMSSHGDLSNREKTELRRSKLRSSIRGEKKVLVRPTVSLSVKKVLRRPIVSLFPKRSAMRVSSLHTEKFKNPKRVSHLMDQSDVNAECEQPTSEDVPEKTLHIIELCTVDKSATLLQSGNHASGMCPSSSSSLEHKSLKCAQNGIYAQLSPPSVKKILRCTQNRNPATQLPLSSVNICLRCHKYGTHFIQSYASSLALVASSKPIHSSSSSECHESEINDIVENKLESEARPRKGGVISADDVPGRKVNFRAGKVVELQPEISTPRGLKFRQKNHNNSQIVKVDTDKINLKNVEVVDCETNVAKNDSVKVVLRHQDVQRKKIVRSLLNNMIEETANKLSKTRKSKVKALVGAFETVISLQGSKTRSTIGAF